MDSLFCQHAKNRFPGGTKIELNGGPEEMAPRKTKKAAGTTSGSGPVTRSKTDPKKEVDVTFYSKLQNYEVSGETQML